MDGSWSSRARILRRAWQAHRPRRVGRVRAGVLTVALVASAGAAYTVRSGDTLGEVAQRHGVSVRELARANDIADPDHIVVGQRLTIPGGDSDGAAAASRTSDRTHVVGRGETLGQIARRHGLSLRDLAAANGITNPSHVMAGALLRLSDSPPPTPGTSGSGGPDTYRVRPGQALSTIALRFGTSVSSLVAANDLASPDRIYAGQTLTVPGGAGSSATRWSCVVPGARFVNDFGVRKPSGRHHEGIDLFAPRGTVVRAPVGGTIRHVRGDRAGLQFVLEGRDGYTYIGTHMDSYGRDGRVDKGDAIGTVGTSGNARGTSPHLHFEMHHGGVVNPYPTVAKHC